MAPPIDLSRRASNLHDMMHDNHAKLLNECPDDWLASLRETFATLLQWQEEQVQGRPEKLKADILLLWFTHSGLEYTGMIMCERTITCTLAVL